MLSYIACGTSRKRKSGQASKEGGRRRRRNMANFIQITIVKLEDKRETARE